MPTLRYPIKNHESDTNLTIPIKTAFEEKLDIIRVHLMKSTKPLPGEDIYSFKIEKLESI